MSARTPKVNLTTAELIEDLEFLADAGVGLLEAGRRTGYTTEAIEKRLQRNHRTDLLARLRALDPILPSTAELRADK